MGDAAPVHPAPAVDVRRAGDRFTTRTDWLDSRHSFSFGQHYDAGNTHHGLLLANNDDRVRTGAGFQSHPHRDMEIVTWVVAGSLVHEDSTGRTGIVHPGLAQRLSAGSGVVHSETNDAYRLEPERAREQVHVIQMWVVPDESGIDPGYEQRDIDDVLRRGGLVTVASGMPAYDGSAAISISNRFAALHAARLQPEQSVQLPEAPYLHLFVARGEVTLEGAGPLSAGDAVRCTASGGQRAIATAAAEVLVWEMHASMR